ncbi:MAG: helix-turn-helix transcriptional regulator [Phycisphaerales bacterium]|nr:helix-turn-helix transcriptional regulator [Phycisphaerales bacterium]
MPESQSSPERMIEAIERIGRLPAIPTHDWCDQAAAAAGDAILPSSGVFAIGVGAVRNDTIERIDAVGVHAVGASEGRADDVRQTLRGIGTLPTTVRIAGAESKLAVVQESELRKSSAWSTSTAGRFLLSRGMTAVLIGAGLIADADPTRALWVLGAVEDGAPIVGDMMFVTVILLALLRRARLALSGVGRDSSEWISPREQEILGQLVLGKSVRQIAEETGRSAHTIHDHVKSLHRKLNATSRGELIARALGHVTRGVRIRETSRKIKQA